MVGGCSVSNPNAKGCLVRTHAFGGVEDGCTPVAVMIIAQNQDQDGDPMQGGVAGLLFQSFARRPSPKHEGAFSLEVDNYCPQSERRDCKSRLLRQSWGTGTQGTVWAQRRKRIVEGRRKTTNSPFRNLWNVSVFGVLSA